jgi:hypothetical protein
MPVNVVALVPGTRPKVQPLDLRMVPGPAARVEIRTPVEKDRRRQQLRMAALSFTKVNDRARDAIRWSSSAPSVAAIDADGMLTAVGAGKTTLTAQAGTARATKSVEVVRRPPSAPSPSRRPNHALDRATSCGSRSRRRMRPAER